MSNEGITPLTIAAERNYYRTLRVLIRHGANVNMRNNHQNGAAAIHFAAAYGGIESVKVLVEEGGADVNMEAYNGERPLAFARKEGMWDVYQYLLDNGAT